MFLKLIKNGLYGSEFVLVMCGLAVQKRHILNKYVIFKEIHVKQKKKVQCTAGSRSLDCTEDLLRL